MTVDDTIEEAAVRVTAVLTDGRRMDVDVDHAVGSLENPLSDAQLQAKFDGLVSPIMDASRASEITRACLGFGSLANVRALTSLCRPDS